MEDLIIITDEIIPQKVVRHVSFEIDKLEPGYYRIYDGYKTVEFVKDVYANHSYIRITRRLETNPVTGISDEITGVKVQSKEIIKQDIESLRIDLLKIDKI